MISAFTAPTLSQGSPKGHSQWWTGAGANLHPMNTTPPSASPAPPPTSTSAASPAASADYFGIDPTVVRVGWVFATLVTGGAALLAYTAMLVVVPRDDTPATEDRFPGVPA